MFQHLRQVESSGRAMFEHLAYSGFKLEIKDNIFTKVFAQELALMNYISRVWGSPSSGGLLKEKNSRRVVWEVSFRLFHVAFQDQAFSLCSLTISHEPGDTIWKKSGIPVDGTRSLFALHFQKVSSCYTRYPEGPLQCGGNVSLKVSGMFREIHYCYFHYLYYPSYRLFQLSPKCLIVYIRADSGQGITLLH